MIFHDEEINRNSSYLQIPWKKKHEKPEKANRKDISLVVRFKKGFCFLHSKPPFQSLSLPFYYTKKTWKKLSRFGFKITSHTRETPLFIG